MEKIANLLHGQLPAFTEKAQNFMAAEGRLHFGKG
jgi:hypothetical protein